MLEIFDFGDCEILLKVDKSLKTLEIKIIKYKFYRFLISAKIPPASHKRGQFFI